MQRGYLKLWRKIQDHRVYQNADLLKLFLHLLMNANIVDKTWNGELIRRGELACGREGLAKDLREKPSTIYKRLQCLAGPNYDLIALRSNNHYTVVTVLNYDTYQPTKIELSQQGSSEVSARYQQGSTTKELKNLRSKTEQDLSESESVAEARKRMAKASKIDLLKSPEAQFFDEARRAYPGTKGGLSAEWKNFEAKYREEMEVVLPLLLPAIDREKEHKTTLKGAGLFVAQWKNFPTWINNRCWEQEFAQVEASNGNGWTGRKESRADRLDRDARDIIREHGSAQGGDPAPTQPDFSLSEPRATGT